MSYTSKVILILDEDALSELNIELKSAGVESDFFDELPDYKETHPKTGITIFQWDDIGWDVIDKDVDFTEQFLDSLEPSQYRFIRIGDEVDDIEDNGSLYNEPFDLRVTTQVLFNK